MVMMRMRITMLVAAVMIVLVAAVQVTVAKHPKH